MNIVLIINKIFILINFLMTTKVFFMYLFNILIITEMFTYWIFKIITKMLIICFKTKIFILRIENCFQLNYLYFDMIWIFFGNFTRLLYFLYPKIIVILFFLIYLILIRTTYEKNKTNNNSSEDFNLQALHILLIQSIVSWAHNTFYQLLQKKKCC